MNTRVDLIDAAWLKQQGLDLPDEDLALFLEAILAEMELRVGTALLEKLNPEQVAEFEKIYEQPDSPDEENSALVFLERSIPDFTETVAEQNKQMKQELALSKDMLSLIKSWEN